MILKHHSDLCEFETSQVLDDNVVKGVIKRLTPYSIYTENQEFIDSFSTTLVNYSPISINIIDYWNKDINDTSIIIPKKTEKIEMDIIQPFEFAESDPPVDEGFGLGFGNQKDYGGALTDSKLNFDPHFEPSICPNELDQRFYINAIIGVQDKLAYVNMFDMYDSIRRTTRDTVVSQRIYNILDSLDLTTDGLFGNTNTLFNENRFLANRDLNTKKGTAAAIRYVGQGANDAQLQGQVPLSGQYYMTVSEDAPFEYSVESNMLGVIYERFVKPLTHPIGMIYNFRTICVSEMADETEYPLVKFDYSDTSVYVDCLCHVLGEEENPIPPDDSEIECIYGTYPDRKIFATPDGTGLWEGIAIDEGTGNIPVSRETGVVFDESTPGVPIRYEYQQYMFENKNFLIQYTKQPDINDTSKRVEIHYYRWNELLGDYPDQPYAKFINQRHCGIGTIGDPERRSYVDETLTGGCESIIHGTFQFLDNGETTPPETPVNGLYEGFCSDLNDNDSPDCEDDPIVKSGGVLIKWTDLYFGWFSFLDRNEPVRPDRFAPSGLLEGFNESYLITSSHTPR